MGHIPVYPRFNIPETFGKALSYEGQLHAICDRFDYILSNINESVINVFETVVNVYDTVSDMVNDESLQVGMTVKTNGFNTINDGGGATYILQNDIVPNGYDRIELDNGLIAEFVYNGYVTPEMFGSYGNGINDDSNIFNIAKNYKNIYLTGTYKIGDILFTDSNIIFGNGTINNIGNVAIGIDRDVDGFIIDGITIDASDSVACIAINGNYPNYGKFESATNIVIMNCNIIGGNVGISASGTTNMNIDNVTFTDQIGINTTSGYGILLQSCYNVNVSNCYFGHCVNGRHRIYVSIDQRKTKDRQCENIKINNCIIDDSDNVTITGNSSAINNRSGINVIVENCTFESVSCACTSVTDGAPIQNYSILNCVVNNPKYLAPADFPSANRAVFNIIGTSEYKASAIVHDCTIKNNTETLYINSIISSYTDINIDNIIINGVSLYIMCLYSNVFIDNVIKYNSSNTPILTLQHVQDGYVGKNIVNVSNNTNIFYPTQTFNVSTRILDSKWKILNLRDNSVGMLFGNLIPTLNKIDTGYYQYTWTQFDNVPLLESSVSYGAGNTGSVLVTNDAGVGTIKLDNYLNGVKNNIGAAIATII